MPIQDSSIKDELIDELELYRAMPMQYSSLKYELVLRRSSSKIQDSSLKYELVLRRSPSKLLMDIVTYLGYVCLVLKI